VQYIGQIRCSASRNFKEKFSGIRVKRWFTERCRFVQFPVDKCARQQRLLAVNDGHHREKAGAHLFRSGIGRDRRATPRRPVVRVGSFSSIPSSLSVNVTWRGGENGPHNKHEDDNCHMDVATAEVREATQSHVSESPVPGEHTDV
jgi:hypothetical protein